MHTLDEEVGKQLHNIRSDVKAAITVATKSVRADLEAAVHTKRQEDTAQLKEQLRSTCRLQPSRQQETPYRACLSAARSSACLHSMRRLSLALCACQLHQLAGLTSELDSLVASSQRTLIVNLTADMERRTMAAQEASSKRPGSLLDAARAPSTSACLCRSNTEQLSTHAARCRPMPLNTFARLLFTPDLCRCSDCCSEGPAG